MEKNFELGIYIRKRWQEIADLHKLEITFNGLAALSSFKIVSNHENLYKSFISQEMLKRGFLASNAFYASTAHDQSVIDNYIQNLEPIFAKIAECESSQDANEILDGPEAHTGFGRLN